MFGYLLAALPTPREGTAPAVSREAFLDACRGFVSEERLADLAVALGLPAERAGRESDRPHVGHDPATAAWLDLSAQVDDAVVLARSARARRDPNPYLKRPAGYRVDVAEAVAKAFGLPDPAARERALDALRWRLADELAASAPDGFPALLARAVQVRLAGRAAGWDRDAGWATLETTLRRIEERHG
jgi:hypothetical protein